MPTPRPIIVAIVGAMLGIDATCPSSPMSPSAIESPMIAVMIGIPIATIVPKLRVRMSIAATIPMTSLDSVSGVDSSAPTGPPAATCIPAFDAGFRRVEHTLCLVGRQARRTRSFRRTLMKAVFSSFESCAAPCWSNGLTAV